MNRSGYEHLLQAAGICVSARIPALLWGDPGQGKTAAIESARGSGWHVETLIISHYEPSDFAGLPVLVDGRVELAPPAWAVRLRDHPGPAIAFFDEFSTASPALQAAALRPLTHYEVGALQLPETVSFLAAANPLTWPRPGGSWPHRRRPGSCTSTGNCRSRCTPRPS